MFEVLQTEEHEKWFDKLTDRVARSRVLVRIRRLSLGNFGDVKHIDEGIFELRIDYGPGYRIYAKRKNSCVVILLAGGSKSSQSKDIARAKQIARGL